jgi:predicted acylesterase/phospholipase RssA
MNLISFSGGQTKITSLTGAAVVIKKHFGMNVNVCGVSSGAFVAICYAMNLLPTLTQIVLKMTLDTIFSYCNRPINKKGKFTLFAISKISIGKNYIGHMDNLEKALREIITKDAFHVYQGAEYMPAVYIAALNAKTTEIEVFNIKRESYERAIKILMASASMPIYSKPVYISGTPYFDAGLKDHNIAYKVLRTQSSAKYKKVISVFSRPEKDTKRRPIKKLIDVAKNALLRSFNEEISHNDDQLARAFCDRHSVGYIGVYIPDYMEEMFDTSKNQLGFDLGTKAANNALK